ncbi:hypothetical protein FKX85_20060 [Echinicola soli]|uniref:Uncharacterized protein n=1 Tax=Echinicola soli TaxID=2591634 RepID=A0A514CN01_9BACT|nr:DUF6520 family protein [Echinicola soli]QDH81199.1 hypothetical protein FKX85_20060 [Echinicola soli]
MKKLLKNMPLMAFVLAAASALAFNLPAEEVQGTKEALIDPSNNEWTDITGQMQGIHYNCDEEVETDCTRELDQFGEELPDTRVEGEYQPL